jgi:hypothetical protein
VSTRWTKTSFKPGTIDEDRIAVDAALLRFDVKAPVWGRGKADAMPRSRAGTVQRTRPYRISYDALPLTICLVALVR